MKTQISNPNQQANDKQIELNKLYQDSLKDNTEIPEETEEETPKSYGLEELKKRRIIPLGRIIYTNKPFFMQYPELTDTTYNVFTFVGPMGSAKSTNVRSMIYFSQKFDPDCITIIFDPMMMEYSKLSYKATGPDAIAKKKEHLLKEILHDSESGKPIQITIEPDRLGVFHLIPRFAMRRDTWSDEEIGYEESYDHTTLEILKRDGGFIWAEDCSRLTESQLFSALNYRELQGNQAIHFYLRTGMRVCNTRFGNRKWFVGDLLQTLREGVKKYRQTGEVDNFDDTEIDKQTGLSAMELQLIEQIEKFNDAGFFVRNKAERSKYYTNFRKFLRLGKVINISYMGFKKTEKIGEDFVVGQTDLMLERLIEISREYMDGIRKLEQGMELTEWENYLLKKWKVSLWFEESEIFVPRDCPKTDIKKWPCIKRLDYLMSFGRKYGFKNFGFITQRVQKVSHMIFEESNNIFLGPLIGEERDKILSDFGVNKLQFKLVRQGQERDLAIRDIVSTLRKEYHEWVYISKAMKTVAPIRTYDSPCG